MIIINLNQMENDMKTNVSTKNVSAKNVSKGKAIVKKNVVKTKPVVKKVERAVLPPLVPRAYTPNLDLSGGLKGFGRFGCRLNSSFHHCCQGIVDGIPREKVISTMMTKFNKDERLSTGRYVMAVGYLKRFGFTKPEPKVAKVAVAANKSAKKTAKKA